MKLARIEANGRTRLALVLDAELIDLTAQLERDVPDLTSLLAAGTDLRALAERGRRARGPRLRIDSVRFRAPLVSADKILGVGMNYHSFVAAAREVGIAPPRERLWFYRPTCCLAGPQDEVWLPANARDFDYEAELAMVIGQRCHRVAATDAPGVIAGFMVANDMTLREQALKSVVFGKSFDTHMPIGPWLVTADEVGDPHALTMRTWVNGEKRQHASTAEMIASCYELIAEISAACILSPGDIILTGTPAGSGIFRRPAVGLAAGDTIRVEIERIGAIENRIVHPPSALVPS